MIRKTEIHILCEQRSESSRMRRNSPLSENLLLDREEWQVVLPATQSGPAEVTAFVFAYIYAKDESFFC